MCIYSPMPHTLSYCALIGKCALIRSNTVNVLPDTLDILLQLLSVVVVVLRQPNVAGMMEWVGTQIPAGTLPEVEPLVVVLYILLEAGFHNYLETLNYT